MKKKKFLSLLTASAMSVCALGSSVSAVMSATAETATDVVFKSECEDLELDGCQLWTSVYEKEIPNYSGEGFVYLTNGTMSTTVTVEEDAMYEITVRYAQFLDEGARMQTICVNGNDTTIDFPRTEEWKDISLGLFRMNKGENTIVIKPQYGYASYDTITVTKAAKHDYSKATATLTDSKATPEAKALMNYLKSVYGKNILSGQQEIYGGGNDGNMELEFEYIKENTGKLPAIRAFDFMNYNPLYGWEDGTTERAVKWVKESKGIITASWHINVPIDFDSYELGDAVDWTKCTYKNYQSSNGTFNTANVLVEGSKEREYFEAAMEDLAEQLTILQENNVPIILRPLHEAQGNHGLYGGTGTAWFWWGDRGPEVFKELWKLLYTTLTEKYNLHNIIWECNMYAYPNSAEWYPGDEYVDLVAFDKYNCDYNRGDGKTSGPNFLAISSTFNSLFELTDGKKMVAMAENDTIPALDNLIVEDAGWLYFCPWYGEHLMSDRYQDVDNLNEIYNSDYCITLDELPADLYVNSDTPGTPAETTTTAPVTTTAPQTTTLPVDDGRKYGDANCDGAVDIADAVLLKCYLINGTKYTLSDEGAKNADVFETGSGLNVQDALAIQKYVLKLETELPIK